VPLSCVNSLTQSGIVEEGSSGAYEGKEGGTFSGILLDCKDCNLIRLILTPLTHEYSDSNAFNAQVRKDRKYFKEHLLMLIHSRKA
jgi:hypothetical protein